MYKLSTSIAGPGETLTPGTYTEQALRDFDPNPKFLEALERAGMIERISEPAPKKAAKKARRAARVATEPAEG